MSDATLAGRLDHPARERKERAGLSPRWSGRARTALVAAAVVVLPLASIIGLAPTEETMGHAQRVLYVHVSVAWLALVGFVAVAGAGLLYLLRRDLWWDRWAQAVAEIGWLCSCLTLVTGSLWAHAAWGTWWTWDPRLVTSFILWVLYGGYLVTRGGLEEDHGRARVAGVLAVVGALDVPLVVMATRWFRAIHPVSPTLEPSMRLVLLLTVTGFTAFTCVLVVCRRSQLQLESLLGEMERTLDS
jgi:heme exporter protein C